MQLGRCCFPTCPASILRLLRREHHPASQQLVTGTPIHLALDCLEPVDLTFYGTCRPRVNDCAADGLDVSANSTSQRCQLAVHGIGDPSLQKRCVVTPQYRRKSTSQIGGFGKLRRVFLNMLEETIGLCVRGLRVLPQEPRACAPRWRSPGPDLFFLKRLWLLLAVGCPSINGGTAPFKSLSFDLGQKL